MPSSSKKKKNEEKITQLKQELLEQQKQVLKARQKISSRKETYLALKTASEIDSDYFKSVLDNLQKQNLAATRHYLKLVEKAIVEISDLPEAGKGERAIDLPEFHSVSTKIMAVTTNLGKENTIEGLLDFTRDPEEVENEYKTKIASIVEDEGAATEE